MSTVPTIAEPEKKAAAVPESTVKTDAAPAAVPLQKDINPAQLPKTRGEWFYDAVQQIGGKGAILTATAAFGFLARYGERWYGPVPNAFRMLNDWLGKVLISNRFYKIPDGQKYDRLRRLAGAVTSTMVLFHGGNIFAPVMKHIENHREAIANWYNRKWGTPEDVKIAHERLKDEPQQNWFDIAKGRVAAWLTVFSAMVIVDTALGKGKLLGKGDPKKYRFDQYEEAFGRWLAGFTKKGKEIWNTPLTKELTEAQKKNKVYQFGKITALDFYATNAGIIIWSFFSRKSAKKRQAQTALVNGEIKEEIAGDLAAGAPAADCVSCKLKSFADSQTPAASFAESIVSEKSKPSEVSLA